MDGWKLEYYRDRFDRFVVVLTVDGERHERVFERGSEPSFAVPATATRAEIDAAARTAAICLFPDVRLPAPSEGG